MSTVRVRERKHARKLAVFHETAREAQRAGFRVDLVLDGMVLRLHGEENLAYQIFPTTGKWSRIKAEHTKHRPGGLATLLESYRGELAKAGALRSLRIDLTVFSDASYCRRTGAGGYGAWMKGAGCKDSVSFGGELKELFLGSTEAETQGVANALAVARKKGLIGPGSTVMIQCDNIVTLTGILMVVEKSQDRAAQGGLAARKPRKQPPVLKKSKGLVAIKDMATELDLVLITRHVKGHKEGPSRQWVNRLCDTIAKEHMNARRVRVRQEEATNAAQA